MLQVVASAAGNDRKRKNRSQVESGVPIEEPGREYLGGIIHIEEVLDDCIDQYNTVFVDG